MMASSPFMARAAIRTCALSPAVRIVPLLSRSFVVLASRRIVGPHYAPNTLSLLSRRQSSTATLLKPAEVADEVEAKIPFNSLEGVIHPNTLKAITIHPFQHTHLSSVQQAIFPLLPDLVNLYDPSAPPREGNPRDLLVKAKTGTGKTMAFLVPAIESRLKELDNHIKIKTAEAQKAGVELRKPDLAKAARTYARQNVGTLIISPTRELATQISVEAANLSMHHPGFEVRLLLGGESKNRQLREWEGRKDIVVTTPGRILDFLNNERGFADAFQQTKLLVLDEADTLLDLGFQEDIERIRKFLPPIPERQTFLFSATLSKNVQQITELILDENHHFINCVSEDDSPVHDHIPQHYTALQSGDQAIPHLLRLIAHDQLLQGKKSKTIVFLSTTKMVEMMADLLSSPQAKACLPSGKATRIYELHSKRQMKSRSTTSQAFRQDDSGSAILVTSDVSARGVDYPGVTRVIQFGAPGSATTYIHRVGRTGRGNNVEGRGDLVVAPWELSFVKRKLSDVKLRPLTFKQLEDETKELADAAPPPPSRLRRVPSLAVAEIPSAAAEIVSQTQADVVDSTFMAQLGFYAGHATELAINKDEMVKGLGEWMKDMCGLESAPRISPSMIQKLGLGGRSTGGYGRSERSSGGYGRSERSSSACGRSGGSSSPYGGGRDSFSSGRSSFGGSGGGGYQKPSSWADRGSGSGFATKPWEGRGSVRAREQSSDWADSRPPRSSSGRFGESSFSKRDSRGGGRSGGGGRSSSRSRDDDFF